MAVADRKRRERLTRERLILETADEMLLEHGYLDFNLDRLAERIEYSKATIYNHFESKEDLVLAVVNLHMERRVELFSRSLVFPGTSRERMFVIGVADGILADLMPHAFPLSQLVRSPSLWERASADTRGRYGELAARCMHAALEVISQGRRDGDIPPESPSDAHILSGLVTMSKGTYLLTDGEGQLFASSNIDPRNVLRDNYHVFLDGVGWKPLRADHDYQETESRILKEVFADEIIVPTAS